MDMLDVKKIRNWRGIVGNLKAGPDFGIHGTSHEKLERILRGEAFDRASSSEFVPAHYFAVGRSVKKWEDEDFYNGLWASVNIALRCSGMYEVKNNQAVFSGVPCLLLGITKNRFKDNLLIDDGVYNGLSSIYGYKDGSAVESFPVGHDFNRELHDLFGLVVSSKDLEKVRINLEKRKPDFCDDVSATCLLMDILIERMIRKVYRRIA